MEHVIDKHKDLSFKTMSVRKQGSACKSVNSV